MSARDIIGKLVGIGFNRHAKQIVPMLSDNTTLMLVREPRNEHDHNAVAVYIKLGFIERGVALELAPLMDTGKRGLGGSGQHPHNQVTCWSYLTRTPEGPVVTVPLVEQIEQAPLKHPNREESDDDEIPF